MELFRLSLVIYTAMIGYVGTVPYRDFYNVGTSQCLPPDDDSECKNITLDSTFEFFTDLFTQLYVCTNGLISFEQPVTQYTSEPFPNVGRLVMLAPFWCDIDTRCGGSVCLKKTNSGLELQKAEKEVRQYFPTMQHFKVKWMVTATWKDVSVCCCNNRADNGTRKKNTFQVVVLSDGIKSFVIYNYDQIEWESRTQVGFNKGDNTHFYSFEGSLTTDVLHLPHKSNVGIPGKFAFRVDLQEVKASGESMECTPKMADIVFLLDCSLSTKSLVNTSKEYMVNVVSNLTIATNDSLISVVSFSKMSKEEFVFNTYTSQEDIANHIRILQPFGGVTNLHTALEKARESFSYTKGARERSIKFIVLLSDGLVKGTRDLSNIAQNLRTRGIKVISVGIGRSVLHSMLEEVAYGNQYVLGPEPSLLVSLLQYERHDDACVECFTQYAADLHIMIDASENVSRDEFYTATLFVKNMLVQLSNSLKDKSTNSSVQISVYAFSNRTENIVQRTKLEHFQYVISMLQRAHSIGSQVNIQSMIRKLESEFNSYHWLQQQGKKPYVIVVTNGKGFSDNRISSQSIEQLRQEVDGKVAMVGYDDNSDWSTLEHISGNGYYVFAIDRMDDFKKRIIEDIKYVTCV